MKAGFPSTFFKNSWVPPFLTPSPFVFFCKFCVSAPSFLLTPLPKCRKFFTPSENLKLLLGCQYGHIIVRRIHTKLIRCAKMFLLLTSTRNTKDLAKIVDNLSFYFGNLGTVIFKEHLSLPLSTTEFLL